MERRPSGGDNGSAVDPKWQGKGSKKHTHADRARAGPEQTYYKGSPIFAQARRLDAPMLDIGGISSIVCR
jgi:hypothetical protein